MSTSPAFRWVVVTVAAASAVGVAVWSGEQRAAPSRPSDNTQGICAARLGRLGQALRVYAQDHDDRFPVAQTASRADGYLFPLLEAQGVTEEDFRCPARPAFPYVYHCYEKRGAGDWPRWMPEQHVVVLDSPPNTWLMADYLPRHTPGPHSQTAKAFNYLCVDGHAAFHVGRPRDVYE